MKRKTSILVILAILIIGLTAVSVEGASASQTTSYDLTGKWNFAGGVGRGTIDITKQSGNEFSGTAYIDSGRTERLINGRITGNTITFTRMWDGQSLHQDYTGTLTIDANGNANMRGTFTQNDAGSWSWSASKSMPAPTPVKPAPVTPTPTTATGNNAEAFESGVRIMWRPASGLGYRIFRSTSPSELGISVTDFYITSTSYADVNVEPNTTYYYTVKPVLSEARPLEGIEEKLGNTIATFIVKTGGNIDNPDSFKHFIMLKMGSPYMSVDGLSQEVDPGRGTTPLIISGRTMVPIRAVVEAMGGTAKWDDATQKIELKARGNTVIMWMDKANITVNGVSKKMDVAPVSRNGRTFVPLRFAAENLESKVDWINSTEEAVIVYVE